MKTSVKTAWIIFTFFAVAWVSLTMYYIIATPKGDKGTFVALLMCVAFIAWLFSCVHLEQAELEESKRNKIITRIRDNQERLKQSA